MKQPVGEKSCVAYVAAMATGTPPSEFKEFCKTLSIAPKDGPPYEDVHFYAYLLSKGYLCGYKLEPEESFENVPLGGLKITCEALLFGQPAYVIVESLQGWEHAMYWDGSRLMDPAPGEPDGVHPSNFKIISWTPIHKLV